MTEKLLTQGEFAPVHWEPLGQRGERLVIGFLLALDDAPATAHITLRRERLSTFLSEKQSDSSTGLIEMAFGCLAHALKEGRSIKDLSPPFAGMSIGRKERISARTPEEVLSRVESLCTLMGQQTAAAPTQAAPSSAPKKDAGGDYPSLPSECRYGQTGDICDFGWYSAAQMRGYIDAERAMQNPAGQPA